MGKKGRPLKIKEEEVHEEVKVEEPITEPEEIVQEEVKKIVEPIKEETSDFDLNKENPYLVVGFKASKHYTTDEKMIENNFKKYLETGE
jgi:hypothetical protein